jgi:hypothetical protein
MTSRFVRCVPMRWHEVRDVAIAIVHAFWAIRGETCPDDHPVRCNRAISVGSVTSVEVSA